MGTLSAAAGTGLAEDLATLEEPSSSRVRTRVVSALHGLRWWRLVVLGLAGLYFIVPLAAAVRFVIDKTGGGYSAAPFNIFNQQGFASAMGLSLRLAIVAIVITLALMVPTAIYVHLRLPRIRRFMDGITSLPIVIPPIVMILGVLSAAPAWLKATPYLLSLEYVILGMPFMYRSLDAGLRAIDHTTLVDASRSLGGGWATTLFRVLIPNLRSAIINGTVLAIGLVFSEYVMSSLDQYQTFSVWIYVFSQGSAQVSVAASLMALVVIWAILLAISFIGSGGPGFLRRRPARLSPVGGEE